MFKRRLGPDPHANGMTTPALANCPDIFELESGDFAIIGINITGETIGDLPPTASCGPDERIVRVPRNIQHAAKRTLADNPVVLLTAAPDRPDRLCRTSAVRAPAPLHPLG